MRHAKLRAPKAGMIPLRSSLPLVGFATLVIFNLALPKGGIKISDLPVTWGYILLLLAAPLALIGLIGRRNLSAVPLVQAAACFLPTTVMVVAKGLTYDLPPQQWLVYATVFGVLACAMLLALVHYLEDIPAEVIGSVLVWAIRFVVLWGLMNFLMRILTGQFFEIPYITVNAADAGEIFQKMNNRGGVMKLVSTFNNGNIFGVCMLVMAPIYLVFEKRRTFIALFFMALVCTLSRTVWLGMVATVLLMMLSGQLRVANPMPWFGGLVALLLIIALMPIIGWTPDKLVEADLGGRDVVLEAFELTTFGAGHLGIPELFYFGLVQSFGIFGMLFPLAGMLFAPIYALGNWGELSDMRKAAAVGSASYLVAALIDGAFVFPPTFVLFLLANGLVYRRGLRPDAVLAMPRRRSSVGRPNFGHGLAQRRQTAP